MPHDLAAQLASTADLVRVREEAGDEAAVPRSVDHSVRVPRKHADGLVADLEAAGFRVSSRRGLLKVTVEFDRDDAVDAAGAARFTEEVVSLADRHDGFYDGWGAMLVKPDRVPWAPPDDAVAASEVDVRSEEARLRDLYAQRLVADGCPADHAAKLSASVSLEVSDEGWLLQSSDQTSWSAGGYSPSVAQAGIATMADLAIQDNRGRRRPAWTSTDTTAP